MTPRPLRQRPLSVVPEDAVVVRGTARLGKRTKNLVKRLRPGDIAVIDHRDLDRISGEDLIACGVAAVVNCAESSTGMYANLGPLLLAQSGIPLVEVLEADLFGVLHDGDAIEIRGGDVFRGGALVASGRRLAGTEIRERHDALRAEIGTALEAFARNTVEHMVEERELLSGRLELPRFATDFRDRPVLVVVRGTHYQRDLRALRPYVRDVKPVIVAVDGAADVVREEGFVPHMILGDMDSVTDATLACGAELVVHAYPDGTAPGRGRVEALGLGHKVVPAPGTSQDVAMMVAAEKGAQMIVSVGSQLSLMEFLDRSRRGMSSTFLTRLRLGELIVDAKGVSRLYRPLPGRGPMRIVLGASLVAVALVVAVTPLKTTVDLLWLELKVLLGVE